MERYTAQQVDNQPGSETIPVRTYFIECRDGRYVELADVVEVLDKLDRLGDLLDRLIDLDRVSNWLRLEREESTHA